MKAGLRAGRADLGRDNKSDLLASGILLRERRHAQREGRRRRTATTAPRGDCPPAIACALTVGDMHERLTRSDRDVADARTSTSMRWRSPLLSLGRCSTPRMIRGDLRRQPIEDRLAGTRNVKQAAARHRRQRLETGDLRCGDPAARSAAVRRSSRRRAAGRRHAR